ncbi:MAG: hypothetical protein FK734_06940 [Asgard group archaeon]|nr:hypothetical protein [Asgard group archaeon]
MNDKSKLVFNVNEISADLSLEEIVAMISTGNRTSPEYGLTIMILKTLLGAKKEITKSEMYDLYMRNREHISKASYYRILNRLIQRGMVVYDDADEVYRPSVLFANALQRLAIAWESIILE